MPKEILGVKLVQIVAIHCQKENFKQLWLSSLILFNFLKQSVVPVYFLDFGDYSFHLFYTSIY